MWNASGATTHSVWIAIAANAAHARQTIYAILNIDFVDFCWGFKSGRWVAWATLSWGIEWGGEESREQRALLEWFGSRASDSRRSRKLIMSVPGWQIEYPLSVIVVLWCFCRKCFSMFVWNIFAISQPRNAKRTFSLFKSIMQTLQLSCQLPHRCTPSFLLSLHTHHTVHSSVIYLNDTVGGGRSIGRVLIMR